jgi:hypothetical protein
VSDISYKADTVVVADRYDPEDGHLLFAQAYERRGAVWTDVILLDRDALLTRLQSQQRVYAGEVNPDIPGDFAVRGRLEVRRPNGRTHLSLGTSPAGRDDLSVPIF